MNLLGKKISVTEIFLLTAGIIFVGVVYYLLLGVYKNEMKKQPEVIIDKEVSSADNLTVTFQVTGIDPQKGDAYIRITPDPNGNLSKDSVTLTRDIIIYTNSNGSKTEYLYKTGSKINPIEFSVDMYDGNVMDYPYDKHKAYAEIYVISTEKDSSGKTVFVEIPLIKRTKFNSTLQGFRVISANEIEQGSGYTGIELLFERTSAVMMFSRFIMLMFWLIFICTALVVYSIVVRKRKIEYSMFAFLSAMIFALPALRDMQPFIPTIGCLSDYASFFWAEAASALGLVIMVFTWLKRPGEKH